MIILHIEIAKDPNNDQYDMANLHHQQKGTRLLSVPVRSYFGEL